MRGHAEQRADGDDAGAADAGDEDVVGRIKRAGRRQWQVGEQRRGSTAAGSTRFNVPPCTVTKLGQKPLTQE